MAAGSRTFSRALQVSQLTENSSNEHYLGSVWQTTWPAAWTQLSGEPFAGFFAAASEMSAPCRQSTVIARSFPTPPLYRAVAKWSCATILVRMTGWERYRIALWSASPERVRVWRASLDDATYELIDIFPPAQPIGAAGLAALIRRGRPELICTDVAELESQLAVRGRRDEVEPLGLIVVQEAPAAGAIEPLDYEFRPGDLTRLRLPADAPAAVLRLACRLLVDSVRLRRQMQDVGRVQRDLVQQALCDPVTELPNRRAWDDELARRIDAANTAGNSLALAIFDLDFFKAVNDDRGHDVGDVVLRMAADTLRGQLRERDFLARIGGDEFGLLISGVSRDAAERIVERVRSALSKLQPDGGSPAPAASAGVAVRSPHADVSAGQLFQLADQALLEAKRAGRGQTVVAGK